jgi:DmsE family decaheme c-type cytochrome
MSCISCHSTHHAKSAGRELVRSSEGELCTSCHSEIVKAYYQRSTHLFRSENHDEKIACSACHNPHGSTSPKLIVAASTNDLCYTCHAELRGPFLWEHAPVRENCQNCHVAHGSNNPTLLKTRLHMLCQECHMQMLNRHQTVAGFDVFTFNRGCANCHNQVHGSNHPSGKTFTH